jgi:serine/threonine protein kinase
MEFANCGSLSDVMWPNGYGNRNRAVQGASAVLSFVIVRTSRRDPQPSPAVDSERKRLPCCHASHARGCGCLVSLSACRPRRSLPGKVLLDADVVLRLFLQTCLGLQHLHSLECAGGRAGGRACRATDWLARTQGILHRDLKPENLLLSSAAREEVGCRASLLGGKASLCTGIHAARRVRGGGGALVSLCSR